MNEDAQTRVLTILNSLGLELTHPDDCLREAQRWQANPGVDAPDLQDFRALPFVTIDNQDSKDLDQALLILKLPENRGFRVFYALADAAWFVRPGSALFEEALRRGATYYAPGIAVPMLPPSLSEGLISLNPGEDRRAMVFDIALDARGIVTETSIVRACIHSQAKLSYDGVQALLDDIAHSDNPAPDFPYVESLVNLRLVGKLRIALAHRRNVIEYNRREPRIVFNDAEQAFDIQVRVRNDVERYNEQISLLCNIEGAKLLAEHQRWTTELQSVFRVHAPPLEKRLAALRIRIEEIVQAFDLNANWLWDEDTELAQYLDALPQSAATRRIRQAIERQIMLTNNASHFAADSGPHHALGVDAYARFSAPMREIVGIFTHKEILEALGLVEPQSRESDETLRNRIIEISNFAKQQQKRLDKEFQLQVIDQYLHDDLTHTMHDRPKRSGTLIGMDNRRIYVALDGFALDIKVYRDDLEAQWGCRYQMGSVVATPSQPTAPTLKTGNAVQLQTLDWHEKRRRFVFEILPSDECDNCDLN